MSTRTVRTALAALAAAGVLATAGAAQAQSETAFDPCEDAGRSQLQALLEYHMAPDPDDFTAAWRTLFCGEAPIRRAAQRVGFPFTESFAMSDGRRVREERNVLERDAFIANYGYLDRDHRMADLAEYATGAAYSPSTGVLRMRFEGDAGTGTRAFRQYRGKWIWFGEQHVIEDGVEPDEEGC